MLDSKGNRIRANGIDGKDGENGKDGADGKDGQDGTNGTNGQDGQNGSNGKDGKDGITPKFKIEDNYWYVSYDNGATWEKLGKATGSNGLDGINGSDGQDGDSIFSGVSQDESFVYFTLSDGTMITLPKATAYEDKIIHFEEIHTKIICVNNWDIDCDGELSYEEAEQVKTIDKNSGFSASTDIIVFNELKYFQNLESIGDYTFKDCTNLWKISFPESIKTIGQNAFQNCTSLSNVTIPSSVIELGQYCFRDCKLKNVHMLADLSASTQYLSVTRLPFYGAEINTIHIYHDVPNNLFSQSKFLVTWTKSRMICS